jgi:DNA-binding beta-propeller fold protein YncE
MKKKHSFLKTSRRRGKVFPRFGVCMLYGESAYRTVAESLPHDAMTNIVVHSDSCPPFGVKEAAMKPAIQPISRLAAILFSIILIFAFALPAAAQIPPEMKTVFVIDSADEASFYEEAPLSVMIVNGDELIQAETWWIDSCGVGPVGLAVDETNERFFVSFEGCNIVEAYDARTANELNTITLAGTSDIAGIEVHEGSNTLLAVDRFQNQVWEFDTISFLNTAVWTLDGCDGAVGIDSAGDTLYVSCGVCDTSVPPICQWPTKINTYDLNTTNLTGEIVLPRAAVGIAVTDYPETIIFATGHFGHDYIQKYVVDTGARTEIEFNDNAKGITVNPAMGYIYATEGEGERFLGFVTEDPHIQVLDMNLNHIHEYDRPSYARFFGWVESTAGVTYSPTPADIVASSIPFGGTVQKDCISHPTGVIRDGDLVEFQIAIENRHDESIGTAPLRDEYNLTHLRYLYSTPASNDNNNDGVIDWSDITSQLGDIAPGATKQITAYFMAEPDPCDDFVEGTNLAILHDAKSTSGEALSNAASRYDYTIECGCTASAECDDGDYCNGVETCNQATGDCEPGTAPCIEDGLFCNGIESCNETLDQCQNTGIPCPGDGLFCNGGESCDEANDICTHAGSPCPDDTVFCNGSESCNETLDRCDTTGNPCPSDGQYCNGIESCDETNDQCQASAVPCGDDEKYCNGNEGCDETSDICTHTGTPCPNDGQYCNGVESCNETDDICTTSGNPCLDDGIFCNGEEGCDDVGDQCYHTGDPCPDDGTFCNGSEICSEVNDECLSGGDPCIDDGEFCNGTESCDEFNDECDHSGDPCPDDGLFCNGGETCNETSDQCNQVNDPCPDDRLFCTGVESCDEAGDLCETTGNPCPDDGLFCSGAESCDETADACDQTGNPCPDDGAWCNGAESCEELSDTCVTTGDPCIDDGLFCNGETLCDEDINECYDSDPPCPDDGVWCTGIEGCDEQTDVCETTGPPCPDDGGFCNGDEVCDEENQECASSGNPCSDDGEFCNGETLCNEDGAECIESGNPCPPGEFCDEESQDCIEVEPGDDDDTDADDDDTEDGDDELWPEGTVTGGCCGC